MTTDTDFELTSIQWETLKALRTPASEYCGLSRFVVQQLMALGLATLWEGRAILTRKGRDVVLRGSPRLWDVAA
ncbi:MAG: hypothetical protein JWQ17_794 [Tardiphaga sp.]|jgi:hypothetical protein|nr:hypothetical protein [Tardiphaga sp.]